LGGLLEKATGMKVPDFADQTLFDPLNITSTSWTTWVHVSGGWTDTGGGLNLMHRDMAKIGQMMLQKGEWNGEQLIPEDWVKQSTQEHVSWGGDPSWGNGYGYLWWLGNNQIMGSTARSYYALGGGGQVIAIFPDLNAVIVVTAGNYDQDEGQSLKVIDKFILPALLGY
jgi:CubicO group peptidase (beta-lactamase class C family)